MTKAAQRARAKAEYDAFLAACPSRQLLDQISNKWVVLVLCALAGAAEEGPRPMRFSELSRQLAGVSQKMLTQTLRGLERDGLLTRTVTPSVPVTVTYELTSLGLSLSEVTRTLRTWAQANMDEVIRSRELHDAAQAAEPPSSAGPDLTGATAELTAERARQVRL